MESVQQVAATYLETSKPSEAKIVMSKLDSINSRFANISDVTDQHGDQLRLLQSKLNDFDREVDQLEDWEMPVIEALERRDVMKMDMNQLNRKLNDYTNQLEEHRPQYKLIHQLGEDIVKRTKAKDTSHVNAVLSNVDTNWKTTSDLLELRKRQLDQKQKATAKYNEGYHDTTGWLTGMERKLSQLQPVAMDNKTLDRQEKELKPFQLEVGTYQPTIEDLNKVGNGLDVLLRELQAPLSTKPHYRSNQLSSTMTKEEMERREIQDRMDKSIIQPEAPEDSDIQRQLFDVNRRYDALKIKITDRNDDIDLARLFLDRLGFVNNRLDWCATVDNRLMKKKPTSRELEPLKKEYSQFQDVHDSIASNKPAVLETIVMGEQFLQENRNRLSPEQQEEMQRKIDELRSYFDQVDHRSVKINTDTQQTIDRLEKELEEEIRLRKMYNDSCNGVVTLIDWVTEAQNRLAEEQPQSEEVPELKKQTEEHKVKNIDSAWANEQ